MRASFPLPVVSHKSHVADLLRSSMCAFLAPLMSTTSSMATSCAGGKEQGDCVAPLMLLSQLFQLTHIPPFSLFFSIKLQAPFLRAFGNVAADDVDDQKDFIANEADADEVSAHFSELLLSTHDGISSFLIYILFAFASKLSSLRLRLRSTT